MSLAGVLGCSGCTSGSKSGSVSGLSWALVFLSLLGTVVGLAGLIRLQTLVVLVGGVELGSGLRDAGRAVGSGCVDAPRRTSTLP